MKFRGNKLLIMLIVLLAAAALLSSVAFAEGEDTTAAGDGTTAASDEFQVSKSKTAEPTELNPDQKQTEITLSLPSGEFKNKIDIVLVIDSSSSTDLGTVFIDSVTGLFTSIIENNPNVDLKVGVVLFTGRGNDAISYVSSGAYKELTPYNDDTKDYFSQSLVIGDTMNKETFRTTFGRGSGPHAGLDMADEWLAADTEVEDDHKYVVLFTDGKGYIWNDENNVPTTIYSQYYQWKSGVGASNVANNGKMSLSQSVGYNKGAYSLDVLDPSGKSNIVYFTSYEDLYAFPERDDLTEREQALAAELTGVNEWDQRCTYALDTTVPTGSVDEHSTTNGVEIFGNNNYQYWYEWKPDAAWVGVPYLQINPYDLVKNEAGEPVINEEGKATFDTETINPYYYQYHFDCLQKGLYKAGHLWTDMNEKYNLAVVTHDTSTGGGLELVGPFKEWLRSNSDYSAKNETSATVEEMFTGIDNDIRFVVNKGVVTDEIVSELDLVMDGYGEGLPFKLTVGGEEIAAEAGTDANSWNFGGEEGAPLYSVTLKDDKNFVWNINTRVENANPVTLSYWLEWNGTGEIDTPTDTNVKATLDYWKSTAAPDQEEPDGTEEFEVPQVTYTEPSGGTLTIIKTVDGPADLPGTTKFNITGPDGFKMEVGIGEFEKNDKGEYVYTYPKSSEEASAEAPAEIQVKGAAKAAETLAPGEYTVTENKSSAMVDGYTLHILGDNGVPRQVDENGYTFRIRNRYADPSDKYVPEELNGEDHYAYMIGYPDGLVHPERNITRAEVATIFFRLLTDEAREANLSTVNSFGDVEDGMWFNVSVSTMANMGIVNGYPDGDFHPNDNITRAEFAAIAARFDKEAKDSANIFTDIDGHWAKSYILRAVNRGWINGYPDSTFRPDRLATRAEVAAMVNRVLVRDPEDPDDLLPDMIEWPDNMDTRAWYYLDIQEATNTHEYERQTKPTEVWMQLLENPDWTKYQF